MDYFKPICFVTELTPGTQEYVRLVPVYAIIPEGERPTTHEPTEEDIEADRLRERHAFWAFLKRNAEEVATWPEWKRNAFK